MPHLSGVLIIMAALPKLPEPESLWTRDFILISLASLFISLGFQMLLPVLPVYSAALGGTKASAGLVIGILPFPLY